jgi:ribosome maturation factor RimP
METTLASPAPYLLQSHPSSLLLPAYSFLPPPDCIPPTPTADSALFLHLAPAFFPNQYFSIIIAILTIIMLTSKQKWARPAFLLSWCMISERETIEQLQSILLPILQDYSLNLVEIEFKPSGKRWLLRVYIDKKGGVTIADCETVSREFGRILDVEDIIDHAYSLEVSSPGLTRPLKKWEDFERNKGRQCRIVTKGVVEGKNEFLGEILSGSEKEVVIRGKLDVFTVPIYAIKKANLEFEL